MNQAQVVLPIAFPTLLLILAATFLLPLPLTPLWLLRGCPALRPLFLALRHRRALLTLCRPWRWLLSGAYLLTLSRRLLPGAYLLTLSRRLLPGAYVLTLSRRLPPGRGGRCLRLRPIVLLHHGVTRLVTVMLAAKRVLLFRPGVPIPRILPLVDRQRGGPWNGATVPPVPSGATLLPVTAPVLAPAWRRIRPPSAKVHRGPPVVADRNSQDEYRHRLPSHNPPGSVVQGARVPVIPLVDPVHAIVEEVVCLHARGVVDRVARHRDQFRVQRQVDPDAHVGKPEADAPSIAALPATLAGVFVAGLVFGGLHEVHRPRASVVLVAVLRPVLGMPWGHVHVDRRHGHRLGLFDDHHRLRIQDGRRPVADVDAPVYPWLDLALDAYPDADIGGLHQRRAGGQKARRDQTNGLVHVAVSGKNAP